MGISFSYFGDSLYKVATPVYEGPLDLLLQLIERAELDITKLALAQVTDQYLTHLRNLRDRAAEDVSAFLVIAARLLQIKSEVLLPQPPVREPGEEDPGEALARQLFAYKKFKEVANFLDSRQGQRLHSYLRLAPLPKVEGHLDLSGLGLPDLIAAAKSVYAFDYAFDIEQQSSLTNIVASSRVTIRQKIGQITSLLRHQGRITFLAILGGKRNRLDVVVTFLAILELVKQHFVDVHQENLFSEIEIESTDIFGVDEEFDLEFGE